MSPDSAGPRFDKAHTSHAPASAMPAFFCSDIALVTYVTPGPSFLKHVLRSRLRSGSRGIESPSRRPTVDVQLRDHCCLIYADTITQSDIIKRIRGGVTTNRSGQTSIEFCSHSLQLPLTRPEHCRRI